MNSRNFSSKNAYKLTKRVVFIVVAIALLYSLFMFNASWDYIKGIEWSRTYERVCEPLEDPNSRFECLISVQGLFETRYERALQSLLVAIALPLAFFIITKTFNYMFPKKREQEEQ